MHAVFQKDSTMNAVLAATSRPPTVALRRGGLVDRLALRVGLALVVWGRRPVRAERYVTPAELAQLRKLESQRHARVTLGPFA